jgi:subtilisin family serine protease
VSALFDIDKLRHALEVGDGAGVRVAVLDSGVDDTLPDFQDSLTSYEIQMAGGNMECVETAGTDELGHGTACAWIIRSIAPKAELHSIKILGGEARGTSAELAQGMSWAIDNGMNVVNISAGVRGPRSKDLLSAEADRALFEGVTFVAAAHNHGLAAYPANLSSVLTVTYDNFKNTRDFRYRTKEQVELEAHGIYVETPKPGGGTRSYTGTSFACPHVTGFVAQLLSVYPDIQPFEVRSLLYHLGRQASNEAT